MMEGSRKRMYCRNWIESTLRKLESPVFKRNFLKDDHGLNKLMVEVRLVKTFLLYYWKLDHSLSSLEDFVCQNGEKLNSLLPPFDDLAELGPFRSELPVIHLDEAVSRFCKILKNFRQGIPEAYATMLDSLQIASSSTSRSYWDTVSNSEFKQLLSSSRENLEDIITWGKAYDSRLVLLLEPLQEMLVFLISSIPFARLQGKSEREVTEDCGVMALSAAHLCYDCWFFRNDNSLSAARLFYGCWFFRDDKFFDRIGSKISELLPLERMLVYHRVRLPYTRVLESGSTSFTLSTKRKYCRNWIESTLRNLECPVFKDDHGLKTLKVELGLLKTFLLYSWKLDHSLSSLEDSVHQNEEKFFSLLFRDLAEAVPIFYEILKDFRQEIHEAYATMLDSVQNSVSLSRIQRNTTVFESSSTSREVSSSSSPSEGEFKEFFDSLQQNLSDIIIWGKAYDSRLVTLLEPLQLQEKLVFLKSSIPFARLQGKSEMELTEHFGVMALFAARLCYVCLFFRDDNEVIDGMGSKISELLEENTPVYHQVRLAYTRVLESGSTSFTLSTKEEDRFILGNFVDSLLGKLSELLLNCPTCFTVSVKHQLRIGILNAGLQFLRNVIEKQQMENEVVYGRTKDLIGAVVNDAGVAIFSLYENDIQETSAKGIDFILLCFRQKIERIKEEVRRYPGYDFLTTNESRLINLLQKNLEELASIKVDCMSCIDSTLAKLQLLVCKCNFLKDDRGLNKLKVELRLVKTFLLYSWRLDHSLSSLEDIVHQNGKEFYSLLLHSLEDELPFSNLAEAVSRFCEILKNSRQEIHEAYATMLDSLPKSVSQYRIQSWRYPHMDCFLKSSSPSRDEFMELLQENLADIIIWGEAYDSRLVMLLEPLQEQVIFLKNFILFARLQGKSGRGLKEHCGVMALSAARLCYVCWFYRDDSEVFDGMGSKISELLEEIKPVYHHARSVYTHILESGSTSLTLSTKEDMFILGNFLDSLLGNLWELLLNCPSCSMVSLKHQMQCPVCSMVSLKHQMRIFYEGLRFLRNLVKKQQEKNGRIKELFGTVVNDAGVLIFSLYQTDIREASAKEIDVKLFCILDKIKLIKAEVEGKCPVVLRFNFPTTCELGLIDLLRENLKELASSRVDPVSFAKDRADFLKLYLKKTEEHLTRDPEQRNEHINFQLQKMKEDLLPLTLFLENKLEQHNQNEKLQLQTMQNDLGCLRSFLENNGEQRNQHEELQALWGLVIQVAYKAEFAIDSLIVGDISFYSLMLFDSVSAEINLLRTKTLEIDGNKYVIKAQKATNRSIDVPSPGSISAINVVDLKDEAQAITEQLIGGSKQLDIISIVGMPGLGKTTLAQKLFHDPSIEACFHIRAWCCISQVYCKKDLLLEILACIDKEARYCEMDEDDLARKLRQHLKRKKYLIVLDDIWDIEAWNALKLSFPDDSKGSRILLTSRYCDVTGKAHHLRLLTYEESWELLQKKLAIIREEGCPSEMIDLGKQIAKNCNGLPLSIVIVAGILVTLDQVGWEEVAERLSSNMVCGTEQCKSLLELSYIHLPDHLKPCLLYFAAFREDQEIPIWRLIWLWIAEGFVQKNELESLEEIAEGYIMGLINRSLVMVGRQSSIGRIKTCRIHDLLHVFCMEKATDHNFLQLLRGSDECLNFDETDYLRRLSIYSQPKHFVKSRIFCHRIRSLLHSYCGVGSREVSYNLSFVFHLKLLKVLDLGQISLGFTFPSELGSLVLLRYLAVLGWMKDIPYSLANLSNLETFLVRTYYSGVSLSLLRETFWTMQKLRHLHVFGAVIDLSLANDNLESSSCLSNLATFSTPKIYLGQSMEKMLRKFPNIRELKCCLLESEESTGDSSRIVAMKFLSQLESLKLLLGNVTANDIEFHLPLNLKKLTLEDFSWSIISTLGKLPNLEVLKLLRQADGVDKWDMEEEESFPNLKFLKLESLNLVRLSGSGDHFPCLEKLVLEGCKQLEVLPSCLGELSPLQLIVVHRCPDFVGSLVGDIKKDRAYYTGEDLKILISEEIDSSWSDWD